MFEDIELVDLMQMSMSMSEGLAAYIAIYLSIVSAYLIVSYLVAQRLTTVQIIIVNAIYVVVYLFQTIIFIGYFRFLNTIIDRPSELDPSIGGGFAGSVGAPYIGILILTLIFSGSIWFMWTVRRGDT